MVRTAQKNGQKDGFARRFIHSASAGPGGCMTYGPMRGECVRTVGRLDLNYQIGPRGTSPEILARGFSVTFTLLYVLRSVLHIINYLCFIRGTLGQGKKKKRNKIK